MSKDKREGWLSHLQEGDRVILKIQQYGGTSLHLLKVGRITATGIIKVYCPENPRAIYKFNPDGSERGRGSSFTKRTLVPANEKNIAKIARSRRIYRLSKFDKWDKLTDEELFDIATLIEIIEIRLRAEEDSE